MKKVSFVLMLVVICVGYLQATTYYISPNGSDSRSGISESEAWGTFSNAISRIGSGDVLIVLDGIYYQSLSVSKSGTASSPITIRAKNDGAVIIDGQKNRRPASISGRYIVMEGIVVQWSSGHTMTISGSYNVLRRVSAYHGKWNTSNTDHAAEYNVHGVLVTGTNNLLEDCVAAGAERHLFIDHNSQGRSQRNIFRRCFATGTVFGGCRSEFNMYGCSETIMENCIGWGSSVSKSLSVHAGTAHDTYRNENNKILGCMFLRSKEYGISTAYGVGNRHNHFENVILYGNEYGLRLYHRYGGGYDDMVKNLTIANTDHPAIVVDSGNQGSTIMNTLIYNNSGACSGSADYARYINSYGNGNNNVSNCSIGFMSVDPGFAPYPVRLVIPDNSPCKGSGENGEDIGANIYYRYENGVLTNEPLFPWPMQDRIKKELGIDVMAELEQMFGTIVADNYFRAIINANPITGIYPLTVNFQGSAINGITPYSYLWDFGDGNSYTSNEPNPTYTYDSPGSFSVKLTITDNNGNQATSTIMINVTDPNQLTLSIKAIKFTEVGQDQTLNQLQKNRWYDLYIYFNIPNGWQEIAFVDVWFSHTDFKDGTISNRGGYFLENSNYIVSLSIASNQIWVRETEGSLDWTNITGKLGRYVDDSNSQHEFNSSEGFTKYQFKLLDLAEPGNWIMKAYIKANNGINSEIYQQKFYYNIRSAITDIDPKIIKEFNLKPNYPNPFNQSTTIEYDLAKPGYISLTISNILGNEIKTLVNEYQNIGQYKIHWDGKNNEGNRVKSGVYYYQLEFNGDNAITRKLIMVK